MRIMWVTFAPIGYSAVVFGGGATQSGGWIDATRERLLPYMKDGTVELHIVCLGDRDTAVADEASCATYHMIKMQRYRGRRNPKSDREKWKKIIREISPDVIQVWGTEFSFGLDIEVAAGNIPVCFYIQGVVGALTQHPAGDIPLTRLFRECGLSSIFKFRAMKKEIRSNKKHQRIEAEMIAASSGVLADNEWTRAQYHLYTDSFYEVPLALNKCFLDCEWSSGTMEKHSIFTVAGGASPIKGIHNAVLAVAQLKQKYPGVKLYIPGSISSRKPHFLYDTVFIRHIRRLIKNNRLENNVFFLGRLTPVQMAERMMSSNVFVMPSCVETHSSSMREAMTVGCPTVSAVAGCAMEFVENGKNAFLYRYCETETLSYYVDRILADNALAERMSVEARRTMRSTYPQDRIGELLVRAYTEMINKKKEDKADEKKA